MLTGLKVATTPWCWDGPADAESLCRQAERAEAMGFHSFWLPENHFGRRAIPAPLMSLAAVAGRTSRIQLGCTSYLLPIRNPVLAAEEVAVLDHLCQGRLVLGLGRGIQPEMFNAFEVDSRDKRKLFAEKLEVMRKAWRGEPIAESNKGAPVCLSPLPLQRPSPPLWVAALGPLALKQVASLGLPYLASPLETLDALVENYRLFNEQVAVSGHAPVGTVPVMRSVHVCDSAGQVEKVREGLLASLPPAYREAEVDMASRAIVGDVAHVRDMLSQYLDTVGMTHLIVRAGLPGIDEAEQLRSHERLLTIVAGM